jgi:UDP-N-acetylmuramyl tripeptide synthase
VTLRGMDGTDVVIRLPDGSKVDLSFPLPGLYNVYNALGAAATASALGVGGDDIRTALSSAAAVFGRVERLRISERDVAILLVKNPAGANEVLRTLTLEDGSIDLWIALNDRIADGRDVSWIWDADFELLAPRIRRVTCAGTRAEEMALRLKYAGVDPANIVIERGLGESLDEAVASRDGGAPLYALPTYTALLELRDLLAERGVAGRWSD